MSLQNVLEKPMIFRPTFSSEDISIKTDRKNEQRFVPSALIPHTIEAEVNDDGCEINFDYLIDETPKGDWLGRTEWIDLNKDISLLIGKFTNKVLKLRITASEPNDLINKLEATKLLLEEKSKEFSRDSVKKNYELVTEVLELIILKIHEDKKGIKGLYSTG